MCHLLLTVSSSDNDLLAHFIVSFIPSHVSFPPTRYSAQTALFSLAFHVRSVLSQTPEPSLKMLPRGGGRPPPRSLGARLRLAAVAAVGSQRSLPGSLSIRLWHCRTAWGESRWPLPPPPPPPPPLHSAAAACSQLAPCAARRSHSASEAAAAAPPRVVPPPVHRPNCSSLVCSASVSPCTAVYS